MDREINISNTDQLMDFFEESEDIDMVYIFGSHGTDYESESSDIDFGILFAAAPGILGQMSLESKIEEIVERKVDIVSLNKCNILLKYKVISEGQKFFERNEIKTADFIEGVLKNYFDFGMKLKRFKEDFREGLREEDQASIEALIDISNHIISRENLGVPESNADSFRILADNGIITAEKLKIFTAMARFRNKVVHLYDEIDEVEIYRIIVEHLGDFDYFINEVFERYFQVVSYSWDQE